MKKRILFVDDEELVLQGLHRMLHILSNEWEMEFVSSGAKALEVMAEKPFDVIVSDMRMPGMNGAQLLCEVMKRSPKTVRLILSGHADQTLTLTCIGSTHQYLMKPCDPDLLKSVVMRATTVDSALENEKLRTLVSTMGRLPSIPTLYLQLVELLQSLDVSMEEVGAIVEKDIAMTGNILKLVNSSFFGLRRRLSTPAEAATYLGVDILKSLVLSINLFAQFKTVKVEGFLDALWQHSAHTSVGAKRIAEAEGAPPDIPNQAFIAGMLHDAGKLILVSNYPKEYTQVLNLMETKKINSCKAEQEIFGSTHAEIGGYLFGLWGLPVPIVEAIALHHSPSRCAIRTFTALTAIHAADVLLAEKSQSIADEIHPQIDNTYIMETGLSHRMEVWRTTIQKE